MTARELDMRSSNEVAAERFRTMIRQGGEMAVAWDRDVAGSERLAVQSGPHDVDFSGRSVGHRLVSDLLRESCYRIVLWYPSWTPGPAISCHMRDRAPLVFAWIGPGQHSKRHAPPIDEDRERTGYWELTSP